MKKSIQRKDLDLRLIFEGLVGDDFSRELEQEIKKISTIIKNEEEAKTTAFSFLERELK